MKILRIDSSVFRHDSVSRRLGDEVIRRLVKENAEVQLTERDLASGIEFLSEDWARANFTEPELRTSAQRELLSASDELVRELDEADIVVLTMPIYNFSIPAVLKAWIDMICRARLSFRYTGEGPVGLLRDRPVYLAMASGGVALGSEYDFASDYLRHIFGFIGIHDIRLIAAERTNADRDASEQVAMKQIEQWLPGGPDVQPPAVAV